MEEYTDVKGIENSIVSTAKIAAKDWKYGI